MATTGHEQEAINVEGLKAALQELKTDILDGKAEKSEMSVTAGTGTDADKTTIQLKSGTSATVLTTHQTKTDLGLNNVTNDAQVKRTEMGANSGVATLDSTGKITSTQLPDYVTNIDGIVPSQATSSNQLADKSFVNSSISTATATFRGTSATGLTEQEFLAWANALTKDDNDYVFWNTVDSDGNTQFKRYKYDGTQWAFEYTLNNSSFTSAQWAAIQSGITSNLVDKLTDLPTNASLTTSLGNKADVTSTVSSVSYDTTNKKIQETINGTTTDVVTASTLITDGGALPLTGGTLTGDLYTEANIHLTKGGSSENRTFSFERTNNNSNIDFGWNYANRDGAMCAFRSVDDTSNPGSFILIARDGTDSISLTGQPDGTLSWGSLLSISNVGAVTTSNYIRVDRDSYGALTLGTQLNIMSARSKNAGTGTYAWTGVISTFGSGETGTTVNNFPVRLGSQSGATWISAGESGKTFSGVNTGMCNTENLYLTTDGSISMYTGVANDSSDYATKEALNIDTSQNVSIAGAVTLNNNKYLRAKDTSGTVRNLIGISSDNAVGICTATAKAGYNTYLSGNNLYLRYGTTPTIGITLNSSGNVGVGTDAPAQKLEVTGNILAANSDTTETSITTTNSNGSTSLIVSTNRGVYDNTNTRWLVGYHKNGGFTMLSDNNTLVGSFYSGTVGTAVGTTAKTCSITGYTLTAGNIVVVRFTNGNSVTQPTLNITSTGAKGIRQMHGAALASDTIPAGAYVTLMYNGSQYIIMGVNGLNYSLLTNTISARDIYVNGTIHWTKATSLATPQFVLSMDAYADGGDTHYTSIADLKTTLGLGTSVPSDAVFTDTKNTAGSTNTTSKIFLIGATSQAANPQTYSNSSCYAQSGNLYATNFYTTSDRSKKKNIEQYSEHISKFTLKETGRDAYGVIAQDVPEMFRNGEEGNYTVNYNSVLSYYVGILENRVLKLEKEIEELKKK